MTGKELTATMLQEKFDVKGYDVVFEDTQGDETGISRIRLDAVNKKIVLVTDGITTVIEPDETGDVAT